MTTEIAIRYGIIYKCTNLINGKIYIGQTIHSLQFRIKGHYNIDKNNLSVLSKAIKKYGKENFKWEIVDSAQTRNELNFKEKFYIKYLNSLAKDGFGYNVAEGGSGGDTFKGKNEEEMLIIGNKISFTLKNREEKDKLLSKNKLNETLSLRTEEEKLIIKTKIINNRKSIEKEVICFSELGVEVLKSAKMFKNKFNIKSLSLKRDLFDCCCYYNNNPVFAIYYEDYKNNDYCNITYDMLKSVFLNTKHLNISNARKITSKGERNPMYGKTDKNNPSYGRKNTEETKKLMRESAIGKHSQPGEKNGRAIKIICIETNKIYGCVSELLKIYTNLNRKQLYNFVEKQEKFNGLTFKFYKNQKEQYN